jgi:hypothetical protein
MFDLGNLHFKLLQNVVECHMQCLMLQRNAESCRLSEFGGLNGVHL